MELIYLLLTVVGYIWNIVLSSYRDIQNPKEYIPTIYVVLWKYYIEYDDNMYRSA